MKNVFLVSILFLLSSVAVMGQKETRNLVFTLGPRVGLNYSTLVTKNPAITSDYVLGYQAGAFIRANLSRKMYLQPEVYFNSKGSSLTIQDTQRNNSVKGIVRFSSIDVPILIGYYIVNSPQFKLRLLAGPMVSFNLKTNANGLTEYNPANYQFKDRIWGGQAGLGMDIGNICIDARYETGFEKINNRLGQRPSLFNISAGIKLF